ncbi:malate dehydrogenase [Tilletiaria anomala UBC 951]|uniref:Malate dehydrogenase n=1 Tax=Tilletiaria anomala (strain ATCC 24038 / CBS 436.72 / UBC 951) TaxID=1037660 RepID=A0A066VK00_TILAU|nr:malate dehydrogenase [Tilletiaria anomala UBC 951]KDN38875.1 malate dehydrogenase [Tilletiaria anomala UBC 951]
MSTPTCTALAASEKFVHISHAEALRFVTEILRGNGVSADDAAVVAESLVDADLRGVDTHGANRIPSYMERVRKGVLDPKAQMQLTQITPVVGQLDAKNGFGSVAAMKAMDFCISAAQTFGISMCSVKHSNHFGMSAAYVLRACEAGMLSLVFTNSSPALPVFGGTEKLMGVSPIACGAPSSSGGTDPQNGCAPHFVLDMAPSIAARGKIYKAKRRGEKIPLDWALDAHGNATDDPAAALEGVMLPMGGPKGSALAIMMDIFSGVLSGSAFAGGVTNPYHPTKPADVGHFIMAIKPDLFVSADEFRQRMQTLYDRVTGSTRRPGVDRIFFPGEIEIVTAQKRRREGIPWVQAEIEGLNEEARKVGVKELVPIQ